MIAAPSSGQGKTTVARGIMALLARQGLRVQPFKCGPDYIDTKFHQAACGRPSINLDTFMTSGRHVHELFNRYTRGGIDAPAWAREPADVAVVEGMMGLFDGYDRDRGSSAEVARVLGLPVVLVVDARSAAYSMAALLRGFVGFRPDLRFAGVIFNKVGSPRHAAMLRDVAYEVGIDCLGCIPKQAALEQGSRYLGLDFSESVTTEELVGVLEANVDCAKLLENSTGCISRFDQSHRPIQPVEKADSTGRIFVARNAEAFSFIYTETLDLLRQLGRIVFFDPETDVPQLDDALLLYLPGGYPEKHLEALVKAGPTRKAIRSYAQDGGHIVAECGGMMYLCKEIVTDEGAYPMCGVLPYSISARQADRRLSLGYRRFCLDGHELRGHEFHYTRFADPQPVSVVQVYNAKGEPVATPILREANVLASYTHLSAEALVQTMALD